MADNNKAAETRKQAQQETAKAVEANSGIKAPTATAMQSAQADGGLPGEPVDYRPNSDETTHLAPHLELGAEAFAELVADKERLSDDAANALLRLERAGQNRTPYVDALMKRLGIKSPYEVTSAGPAYTINVTPVARF